MRFILIALGLLTFAAQVRADSVTSDVSAVVNAMAARWSGGARETIPADFWDKSDPAILYLAGEQATWFVGYEQIYAYLGPRPNAAKSISDYGVSNLAVRAVAEGVALATWDLHYQFQRGTLPAMGERLRASALLRKTDGGWKFFMYQESPKSSMTYLRDLYEDALTPDFRSRVEKEKR